MARLASEKLKTNKHVAATVSQVHREEHTAKTRTRTSFSVSVCVAVNLPKLAKSGSKLATSGSKRCYERRILARFARKHRVLALLASKQRVPSRLVRKRRVPARSGAFRRDPRANNVPARPAASKWRVPARLARSQIRSQRPAHSAPNAPLVQFSRMPR